MIVSSSNRYGGLQKGLLCYYWYFELKYMYIGLWTAKDHFSWIPWKHTSYPTLHMYVILHVCLFLSGIMDSKCGQSVTKQPHWKDFEVQSTASLSRNYRDMQCVCHIRAIFLCVNRNWDHVFESLNGTLRYWWLHTLFPPESLSLCFSHTHPCTQTHSFQIQLPITKS